MIMGIMGLSLLSVSRPFPGLTGHRHQHRQAQPDINLEPNEKPRPMTGQGWNFAQMVELRGFEPLTSSMPWRRATNCAIAPCLTAT